MQKSLAVLILALLTAKAEAAGSNIALADYPGPSCTRPLMPQQPQAPRDENSAAAVSAFNLKVKQYNQVIGVYNAAIAQFNGCMQTYIDNGNADMTRIKQRLDQAVAEANSR